MFETKAKNYLSGRRILKIPAPVLSVFVATIFGIAVISILPGFGPSYILHSAKDIANDMIVPVQDRLGVTVAENRQPYFGEWASSFGPSLQSFVTFGGFIKLNEKAARVFSNMPIVFWLFFVGSIYLFFVMLRKFEMKERGILTLAYAFFLVCLVFSRYSSSSILNGVNNQSLIVYALGFIALIGSFGYYYYKEHVHGKDRLKSIDFGLLLLFVFFFLSIVSARGSVRTIMVLVPTASIFAAYLIIAMFGDIKRTEEYSLPRVLAWIFVIFVTAALAFAGFAYYNASKNMAQSYIPSSYTQQWQKAMAWVRENTPQNAVFGHWWDYGYWLQTMGERATVLDGGNAIVYWNHLMGRHALTGPSNQAALDYLYAHNTTHFLIDSTDIGKYGAFSSIGADVNYDRRSWISTFARDDRQSRENKNSTTYLFAGGTPLDDDLIYNLNGTKITLPSGSAGVAAVALELNSAGDLVNQPQGIFIYQRNQYVLPLRYAYVNKRLYDYQTGVESGVFTIATVQQSQNGGSQIVKNGALLYLSNRTVKSQLARLYLYKENNPNFKLVHSEDEFLVAQLKSQYGFDEDFIIYGELRGPIRIWEIKYPKEMKVNPEYLRTSYPDVKLSIAK